MIAEKRSFKLKEIEFEFLEDTITAIERLILSHDLTCTIYTSDHFTALRIDVTVQHSGIVAERTVAAHHTKTYDSDYIITKSSPKTLAITYKNKNTAYKEPDLPPEHASTQIAQ